MVAAAQMDADHGIGIDLERFLAQSVKRPAAGQVPGVSRPVIRDLLRDLKGRVKVAELHEQVERCQPDGLAFGNGQKLPVSRLQSRILRERFLKL